MMKKKFASLAGAMALVVVAGSSVAAPAPERGSNRALPASIPALKLEAPLVSEEVTVSQLHESLRSATGEQKVIVRLRNPSVAQLGLTGNEAAQAKINLRNEQADLLDRIYALDPSARFVASVQVVLNAVFVEVDATALPKLAMDKDVMRITPVGNYQLDLSETVPYIGAAAVQATGVTGRGIKVAVLDSGIDYTHAAFGGPGTVEAYDTCYGQRDAAPSGECATFFGPGAEKVLGGYDFVGEGWPNTALAPDPNPIDFEGHGTHVADIIGGLAGVAPGVGLYAVKVCSAVSSSCSGIALIQGMEFAVNPNGDGRLDDRVDIINMSLGSNYGQPFDDDLAAAVDNATAVGVLTVASAGNGGDKPYINGTPAAANTALSVAQTAVPSGFLPLMQITAPAGIVGSVPAVFQPWSAKLAGVISGPVQYGDGAGGNLLGCAPFAQGSLAGKIVLKP
jgi:subtilisin family serine protease